MLLPYKGSKFPLSLGLKLQGKGKLNCSWSDLTWAATTVGRPGWAQVFQYGWYSSLEYIYRLAMIQANLGTATPGVPRICKTAAFTGLDPSEKTAISYFIGLTVAKILSWRLFNAPWPQHLDKFAGSLTPSLKRRKRPDLLALDTSGRWIVLEAKGRTNTMPAKTMKSAKTQAKAVATVNGVPPYLRIAVGSYFVGQNLAAKLEDPPEGRQSAALNISEELFFREYYAQVANFFLERTREIEKVEFRRGLVFSVTRIPEVDASIGIADTILAAFRTKRELQNAALAFAERLGLEPELNTSGEVPRALSSDRRGAYSSFTLGADGIAVALGQSWSDQQMALEPENRTLFH
jgi:hypothetical protein